jgi:hypothetical protein
MTTLLLPWRLHDADIKKWLYNKYGHGTIKELNYIILA